MAYSLKLKRLASSIMIAAAFFNTHVASSQQPVAFLGKGALAIDPDDHSTLVLYVPRNTLLYNVSQTDIPIGSSFGGTIPHRRTVTQDGVEVLIPSSQIRWDIEVLADRDFVISRSVPLCSGAANCDTSIWTQFDEQPSEDGFNWKRIWPGATGKFLDGSAGGSLHGVRVQSGTWEDGFFLKRRSNLSLEDFGYVTLPGRAHPLYRYAVEEPKELQSPCGHAVSKTTRHTTLTKVEAYAKLAANASVGINGDASTLPINVARGVLRFLGLEAEISAEAFVDGDWKRETETRESTQIIYGDIHQDWTIRTVQIDQRPTLESSTDTDYAPYGSALVKKVYTCTAGQRDRMIFVSFLFSVVPPSGQQPTRPVSIALDAARVQTLGLRTQPRPEALISVNAQDDHYKVIDFFLRRGVPKSIATFFIKEFNRPRARPG